MPALSCNTVSSLSDIIAPLSSGQRLNADSLERALSIILAGEATDAHITDFLLGLERVGIGAEEIRAAASVMRANMTPVPINGDVIDIVGTGGTGLHTLSISTACAFVCAGAGARVAKHGNRAASSLTGTADTLSTLGVNLNISPEHAARCVETAGIGFLFAPNHHPAMRHVAKARKAIGTRTIFNLLGPMCNPAGAKRLLLGVAQDRFRRPIAEAMAALGVDFIWVVHGADGLDELSTTGPSAITQVKNGVISELTLDPQSYGFETVSIGDLRGGEPAVNARALTTLLDGALLDGAAYRDIVLLNSGAALMIAGIADSVEHGIELARHSIDSGKARAALKTLIEVSNSGGDND